MTKDGTASQDVVVRAAVSGDETVYGEKTIHIKNPADMNGFGFDEDYTKLMTYDTFFNLDVDNGVVYVVAIYDEDGTLMASMSKELTDSEINYGEQMTVNINMPLPTGFDKEKHKIKVYTWSR